MLFLFEILLNVHDVSFFSLDQILWIGAGLMSGLGYFCVGGFYRKPTLHSSANSNLSDLNVPARSQPFNPAEHRTQKIRRRTLQNFC
jgi:hypothetical protein